MKRLAILFSLLFISLAYGQVRIDVELVNVYLTATDKDGRFITDLKPEELVLKEDGTVQSITHFSNFAQEKSDKLGEKDVPLTVAFVIDTSESMGTAIAGQTKLDLVKSAAFQILDELKPEDKMMMVGFSEVPDEVTPLTSDKKKLGQDLLFQDVEGGRTALLDAVYFAMQKLNDEYGRKIVVVCSDGEDTASLLKFDEVLSNLVASDITVLAFGTMALSSSSIHGRFILEKLAKASGGYAFFPTSLNSVITAIEKLRHGMRSQYSLAYRPINNKKDGSWRKIEIVSKRRGIKLRYREGYHAS